MRQGQAVSWQRQLAHRLPTAEHSFMPVVKRWVEERTIAELNYFRRVVMGYERQLTSYVAF